MTFKLPKPKRRINEKFTVAALAKEREFWKERSEHFEDELEKTKKQLEIATECLKDYADEFYWDNCKVYGCECDKGCYQDYGYKEAQTALQQIEELSR